MELFCALSAHSVQMIVTVSFNNKFPMVAIEVKQSLRCLTEIDPLAPKSI